MEGMIPDMEGNDSGRECVSQGQTEGKEIGCHIIRKRLSKKSGQEMILWILSPVTSN
jgi:hypothetical protein